MDERLKKKLELLGEPTLPESLRAGELFRWMDSGELVLPEGPEAEAAPVPSGEAIPWARVLRRGIPIAACLALVVLLAQGGLWRMGSSGANLARDTSQITSGVSAPAGDAPQAPDPGPMDIANGEADTVQAEDDDQESAGTADGDEADIIGETADEDLRPDSGGDELDKANPDSGPYYNPDNANPDMSHEQLQTERKEYFDYIPQATEICGQLYLYDESLTGLTPVLWEYGENSEETLLYIYCSYENDAGEEVAYRYILCSITPEGDGTYTLTPFSYMEWDGGSFPYSPYDIDKWGGKPMGTQVP